MFNSPAGILVLVALILFVASLLPMVLFDMLPLLAMDNAADLRRTQAVALGEYPVLHAIVKILTHLAHNIFRDFCEWPMFPARLPSLRDHICNILGMGGEKQVPRIYAVRIITIRVVVADLHAWGDWSMRQFPRCPRGYHKVPLSPPGVNLPVAFLYPCCPSRASKHQGHRKCPVCD